MTELAWQRVDVDGARVDVMTAGEGDPLVFLHGWGLTPRSYAEGLAPLTKAGLRVVAPSLPGFGGSDAPPPHKLHMREYARRVGRLLDALDLVHPAFVVGHSFGGGIGIRLAADRPDLVRSLTLVDPVGGTPGRRFGIVHGSWPRWALGALGELRARELMQAAPGLLRDLVPNLVRHPVTLAVTGAVAVSSDLADTATRLVESGLPVLFIWNDEDRLIAPGAFAALDGVLTRHSVPGRHGWLLTDPAAASETLHNALVVHALLERRQRGEGSPRAVVLPVGTTLADLFPTERRRRARPVARRAAQARPTSS